jgi:hypothetical protein
MFDMKIKHTMNSLKINEWKSKRITSECSGIVKFA